MKLIDADCLVKTIEKAQMESIRVNVLSLIHDAPTVEITEEQAIDKLHETGWLPLHDKEMTERPTGTWICKDKVDGHMFGYSCSNCGNPEWKITRFCPNCGAKMKGAEE